MGINTTSSTSIHSTGRVVFLDYLRALACLTVIIVHSCEFFYIGGDDPLCIKCLADLHWANLIDSLFRPSVPLFVLASSYLLFPLRDDTATFFKRRFTRVAIPFIIWLVLYAVIPQYGGSWADVDLGANLKGILLNFPGIAGHLWFVYMLLGVYLLMPIITPWIKSISKREEQIFIGVWFLTTFIPFLRYLGQAELYGEAIWNEFSLFYYISGYIGYVVIGHYIRTYIDWSWRKTLAVALPLFVVGYAITAGWFYWFALSEVGVNAEGMILSDMAALRDIEASWRFCTPNVAMMSVALFICFKKITCDKGLFHRLIADISRLSYGMYLMHIFVLNFVFRTLTGSLPTPLAIVATAATTYTICYLLTKAISYIPKSKYLIG